jgi:branched-chain amino acid transport system substrate-binding protein
VVSFTIVGLAVAQNTSPSSAANEILIGELGSFTGPAKTFAVSTSNGIELAVENVNQSGGLLGRRVRIITADNHGNPVDSQTAVEKLITTDKVVAVLGEVASSRTMAAASVAQKYRIPMISPSSTNPRATNVGDYIFRVCFIDPFQGFIMAKFATNSLKLKNVAVLRDIRNDYSVGIADVFAENIRKTGGTIVDDLAYSEGDTDFSPQLMRLKSRNVEAIFVPGYYAEAGLIAKQAREQGLTVPLLGVDGWDSPKLFAIGGAGLNGSYFSHHYSPDNPDSANQKFQADYRNKYHETADSLAALGYDAANVLFDAIRRANSTDASMIRDWLAQTKNYPGITGSITIDPQRNASKPAVVLQIQGGKFNYSESVQP